MKKLQLIITTTLSLLSFSIFAQAQKPLTGTIKGKVIDKATKQSVPGATVLIKETQRGSTTDTAGVFTLIKINEGVYQLVASFIGYQEKTINDIRVVRNKTNYFEIEIEESLQSLKEVVIKIKTF